MRLSKEALEGIEVKREADASATAISSGAVAVVATLSAELKPVKAAVDGAAEAVKGAADQIKTAIEAKQNSDEEGRNALVSTLGSLVDSVVDASRLQEAISFAAAKTAAQVVTSLSSVHQALSKKCGYRFSVKRGPNDLIESVIATPIDGE